MIIMYCIVFSFSFEPTLYQGRYFYINPGSRPVALAASQFRGAVPLRRRTGWQGIDIHLAEISARAPYRQPGLLPLHAQLGAFLRELFLEILGEIRNLR